MRYEVIEISLEGKEDLAQRYSSRIQYEVKSEIYGCCIKLLTDRKEVRDRWSENLYSMSQNIRSHGRLYVLEDGGEEDNRVYYDAHSKTAFLLNFDYYGWIKSLALSVAGDILEDEHSIYSVHGSCIDTGCGGVCIVGASGAGKTTQTYGLLRDERVRVVSDDWFYARVFGNDILAYGSEKNFYIRADLAKVWPEFRHLVDRAEFDPEGRAVVDLRWVVGKGRILPLTTLRTVILLVHREGLPHSRSLAPDEALGYLREQDYFNPHLLVHSPFKSSLRKQFFERLFSAAEIFLVNTTGTPEETQRVIRGLTGLR